jgi:hypothetical protein
MSFHKVSITYRLLWIPLAGIGLVSAQDPPTRVGRLSYVGGSVSFQPGGLDDWVAATLTSPLLSGLEVLKAINRHSDRGCGGFRRSQFCTGGVRIQWQVLYSKTW